MVQEPGRGFAGRYRLVRCVDRVALGEGWEAVDQETGDGVIVKFLVPPDTVARDVLDRVHVELKRALQLRHPNIIHTFAAKRAESGGYWIAVQSVESRSLATICRERQLEVSEACTVGGDLIAALRAASEAGVTHGSLRAGCVRVTPQGRAVLGDFGLARGVDLIQRVIGESSVTPSARCRAPELQAGGEPNELSDVYSLGCTLYTCLAGSPPFAAEEPAELAHQHASTPPPPLRARRPSLPHSMVATIEEMMAKEARARPVLEAASEVMYALTVDRQE